jgi:hypothetical protein
MDNLINPFREFRAEQMGQDLWKLYVPGPFKNILTPRPLILEGGRGSGKTMFFLCNSWKEKINILKAEGRSVREILASPEFVGLYYKVDTAFVTSMEDKGDIKWEGIFSTYLGICIVKEMFYFLKVLISEGVLALSDLLTTFEQINYLTVKNIEIQDVESALRVCEIVLDGIETVINSPEEKLTFRPTIIGRLINKIVEQLRLIPQLQNIVFRIFIDEYETLLEYQQKQINTLIKHSNNIVIYNIGMRPKGMLTPKTSGGGAEIIQAPHDYNLFKPEMVFDPEGEMEYKTEYSKLLKDVCRLRFKHFQEVSGLKNINDDIEYYLGKYNMDKEIAEIIKSKDAPPFLSRLRDVINRNEANSEKSRMYFEKLGQNAEPLNARLHLCLLLRSGSYKPSLEKILKEYEAWQTNDSAIYKDWYHNAKFGLVFLMAREYDRHKQYNGLDVYMMLSTGVIRYFLELCEQAFDFAMLEGFNWDNPRPITADEQTKAAKYVSRYKIKDIEGYEPFGRALRIFVQNIGNVFKELHRSADTTLGEPEPNHLCTNDFAIKDRSKKVLNSAIMWGVLQERIPTKEKTAKLPSETIDYHLNKIYCPFFEISYRKKRKIFITSKTFEAFLSGEESEAKNASKDIISRRQRKENDSSEMFVEQLTIFDGDEDFD